MNGRGELTVATRSSRSNYLEALNSKYTCLYEPPSSAGATSYLTSLWVYGNREVEDEPLVSSKLFDTSMFLFVNLYVCDTPKKLFYFCLNYSTFNVRKTCSMIWSVKVNCMIRTVD